MLYIISLSNSVKKDYPWVFSFLEVMIPNKPSDWHFIRIFKSRRKSKRRYSY